MPFTIAVGRYESRGKQLVKPIQLALFDRRKIAHAYAKDGSFKHPSIVFYVVDANKSPNSIGAIVLYQNGKVRYP